MFKRNIPLSVWESELLERLKLLCLELEKHSFISSLSLSSLREVLLKLQTPYFDYCPWRQCKCLLIKIRNSLTHYRRTLDKPTPLTNEVLNSLRSSLDSCISRINLFNKRVIVPEEVLNSGYYRFHCSDSLTLDSK